MEPETDNRKASKKPLFALGGVAALALGAWLAFGFFGIQTAFIDETVDEAGPVFGAVATSETAAAGAQPAAEPLTDSSTTTEGTVASQAAESTTTAAEPTTTAAPTTTEAPLVPEPTTTTTTTAAESPSVTDPSTSTTAQPAVEEAATTTTAPTTTVAPTTTAAPTTTTTAAPTTTTTTAAPTTTAPPAEPGEVVTTHSGNFSGTSRYDVSGDALVLGNGTSQRFVRFEGFESSNGPDLKVYLRSAGGAFVNLGELKGNVGAQNYEIPADVDLADFGKVEIWCERFSVAFGSAQLTPA